MFCGQFKNGIMAGGRECGLKLHMSQRAASACNHPSAPLSCAIDARPVMAALWPAVMSPISGNSALKAFLQNLESWDFPRGLLVIHAF
jgi:hypothetical protein